MCKYICSKHNSYKGIRCVLGGINPIHMSPNLASLVWLAAAWSMFLAFMLERLLHAVVFFTISSVCAHEGGVKRFASISLVQEGFVGVLGTVQGVVQAVGLVLTTILKSWVMLVALLLIIFVLICLQHEAAALITAYITAYNSETSSVIRYTFLLGLQYSELFLRPLLALWNVFWYIGRLLGSDVLMPMLMDSREMAGNVVFSLGLFARSVSLSLVSYVHRWQSDCSIDRLLTAEQISNKTVSCFVPGARSLDLITPLGDLRLVAMYTLLTFKRSCKVLSPPLDILFYPLMDINFAKGLHSLVNGVLYFVIAAPIVTVERCNFVSRPVEPGGEPPYPAGHWMRLLMCTPDLTPGFNYFIAGVRRFGILFDNFLNAIWMVLLAAIGLPTPQCAVIPLQAKMRTENTLFGGNETRVVGLTSGAYALTDGLSVHYTMFLGQINTVWAPYVWRGIVDIKHGIAAVTYDSEDAVDANSGGLTLSMLGCRCLDVEDPLAYVLHGLKTRMEIECSILKYDPAGVSMEKATQDVASPHYVPVAFAVPETARYMRCAMTKITVDSARWPLSRLGNYEEVGKGKNYYDVLDGEFTGDDGVDGPDEIDAVIWVMPACDADHFSPACQAALPDNGCYPYCMAARRRGSRNDGLTLYSASDWIHSVQLLEQDCTATIRADTPNDVVSFQANRSMPAYHMYKGVSYSNLDIIGGQWVFSQAWDPSTHSCSFNPTMVSRVARGTALTEGADLENFKALVLPEQPFAVAGETALTLVTKENGDYAIMVQRLYGQQGTGFFTLVTVNRELKAEAPCLTQNECATNPYDLKSRIATIPYAVYS